MRQLFWSFSVTVIAISLVQASHGQGQPGIAWQPDIPTAQQIAGQTNKLVLVHFWSTSCLPCAKVEREVFSRPEICQSLNNNFVCVKINTDNALEIARAYNITTIPTDVVLSADGRLIAQLQSPTDANQYLQKITQAAAGYRQLTGQVAAEAQRAGDYARQLGAIAVPGYASLGSPAAQPPTAPVQPNAPPPAQSPPAGPVLPPQNSPAVAQTQGPAVPAYSDDRYADYFRQRQAESNSAPVTPGNTAANIGTPDTGPRYATTVPPQAPSTSVQGPYMPNAYSQNGASAGAPTGQNPVASPPASAVQLPAGSPPLGLDGYCTVMLKEQKRWTAGDPRWGAVHRGRTYLFTGPEEQKKFLASPDAYAPVMSGNDPVLALDQGQAVTGKREHGVFFENRVYLFSDEASLAKFYQNPIRYAAEVMQAMR